MNKKNVLIGLSILFLLLTVVSALADSERLYYGGEGTDPKNFTAGWTNGDDGIWYQYYTVSTGVLANMSESGTQQGNSSINFNDAGSGAGNPTFNNRCDFDAGNDCQFLFLHPETSIHPIIEYKPTRTGVKSVNLSFSAKAWSGSNGDEVYVEIFQNGINGTSKGSFITTTSMQTINVVTTLDTDENLVVYVDGQSAVTSDSTWWHMFINSSFVSDANPEGNYTGNTPTNGQDLNNPNIEIIVDTADDLNVSHVNITIFNSSNGDLIDSFRDTTLSVAKTVGSNFTLLDGDYSFNVTINDSGGNEIYLTTRSITIDTKTPDLDFVNVTPVNNTLSNDLFLPLNATCPDANPGSMTFYIYDENLTQINFSTSPANAEQYFLNYTNIANLTTYYYNATCTDDASNVNLTGLYTYRTGIPGDTNTSFLGAKFNVSDVTIIGDSYQTVSNVSFNTSILSNYTFFNSFNVFKNGAGSNDLGARILVDGTQVSEEIAITIAATGEYRSVGLTPILFELAAGVHTLTIQMNETGVGNLGISNYENTIINLEDSRFAERIQGTNYSISTTYTSPNYVNISTNEVFKGTAGGTYHYANLKLSDAGADTYLRWLDPSDQTISPIWARTLAATGAVGSVLGTFLQTAEMNSHNMSLQARTNSGNVTVNGGVIFLDLSTVDDSTHVISSFETSNASSNETHNYSVSQGTHLLASQTMPIKNGNAYFLSSTLSIVDTNESGNDFSVIINNTAGTCTTTNLRTLTANNISNVNVQFLCTGLTNNTNETFNYYLVVPSGNSAEVIDEDFAGFEVLETALTILNTAPLPGVIDEPDNLDIVSGNTSSNWTAFTDPQGDSINYSVRLNGTLMPGCENNTDLNCTIDTTVVSDGNYWVNVTATDGEFLVTVDNTVLVTVNNDPPVVAITYPLILFTGDVVNGTCTGNNLDDIVVNDTRLTFNSSFSTSVWEFYWNNGTTSVENLSLLFTCNDTSNLEGVLQTNLTFDVGDPFCSPLTDQTVTEGNSYAWNVTCQDDLNYYYLNVTCTGGTEFSYYEDNINSTSYNFVNNTGALNTTMVCTFESADGHTKKNVKNKINKYNVKKEGSKIKINDFIYVELDESLTTAGSFENIIFDFESKNDRVKFKYKFASKNGKETIVFYVHSKDKINYVENSLFPAWFVLDNYYWIDFELANDDGDTDYEVYRVNQTTFAVEVLTDLDELDFNSVGIININTQTQSINVASPLSAGWGIFSPTTCYFNSASTAQSLFFFLIVAIIFVVLILNETMFKLPIITFLAGFGIMGLGLSVYACAWMAGIGIITFGILLFIVEFQRTKSIW